MVAIAFEATRIATTLLIVLLKGRDFDMWMIAVHAKILRNVLSQYFLMLNNIYRYIFLLIKDYEQLRI